MAIHKKILELRNSIGSSPIKYAHRKSLLTQPEAIRAANAARSDNERLLKQYFCIWGIKDDYGTVPIKGCFTKSINDRGPNSNASYKITALYMHSQRDSVGMPIILKEDDIGLYAEVDVLPGIQVCDELLIRHKRGTCNNGSYGFDYVWDKMEYDEANDAIIMKECDLYEISFVTIGSQTETYGVRNANGVYEDIFLEEDTNELFKRIPRKEHLELRSLIDRHITLAKSQPIETRQQSLDDSKPQHVGIDYNYLTSKINLLQ